ncbi:MAG: aminodeoxychorismate synthase component I [Gammaproteobacteria bacterium]|nr:aminodeoxychorismate synthase component I [Gammaproteobacteria bacterium]
MRALAYRYPERYPVLLDSAAVSGQGSWSMLLAASDEALYAEGDGGLRGRGMRPEGGGFFEALEHWWRHLALPADPRTALLPFSGGWALFLGYELAGEVEPSLQLPADGAMLRACALRTPAAVLHDHRSGRSYLVSERGGEWLCERLLADLAAPPPLPAAAGLAVELGLQLREEDPARFRDGVRRAQAHIQAGDIYQANLSRQWRLPAGAGADLPALYEHLRQCNPAPFAAWARFGGVDVLSSSPERLVRVCGGRVETRPIAGTRPRSRSSGGDALETEAMLANAKERAEHVMLIDLERNDLGRVCRAGSVRVGEFMIAESYEHVHHIVSNVEGVLLPDVTPVQVIRAVFPGGTITGCPKVRCMQIIGDIEGQPRGAYTGSLGYLNRDGSLDLNILIRSFERRAGVLGFRAGAGIVADSDCERELAETRAKARGLLAALGSAGGPTGPRP